MRRIGTMMVHLCPNNGIAPMEQAGISRVVTATTSVGPVTEAQQNRAYRCSSVAGGRNLQACINAVRMALYH